jgi:FkbM family methyltransferase
MLATAQKIRIARGILSMLRLLGFGTARRVERHGITFDLDLNEGIDLSLFLLGSFQPHILSTARKFLTPGGTAIDVGANIGSIALFLAAELPGGHVYAFEPSDPAFARLTRNIGLNQRLAPRITAIQSFVADSSRAQSDLVAYSSWPLSGAAGVDDHPVHKGRPTATRGGQVTLDEFVRSRGLASLDLIKIDTDGHEFAVLNGAHDVLTRQRPAVIFEACEYLMQPPHHTFEDFAALFARHAYCICSANELKPVTAQTFRQSCPKGGSLDLVAVPDGR